MNDMHSSRSTSEQRVLRVAEAENAAALRMAQGTLQGCTAPALASVAVCMYGLFRGTQLTMPAFRVNVYEPLKRQYGSVDLFVHALLQEQANHHPRGQELGRRVLPRVLTELALLSPCRFTAEDQAGLDVRLSPQLPHKIGKGW